MGKKCVVAEDYIFCVSNVLTFFFFASFSLYLHPYFSGSRTAGFFISNFSSSWPNTSQTSMSPLCYALIFEPTITKHPASSSTMLFWLHIVRSGVYSSLSPALTAGTTCSQLPTTAAQVSSLEWPSRAQGRMEAGQLVRDQGRTPHFG